MDTNIETPRRRLKCSEAAALLEEAERVGGPLGRFARSHGLEPYQLYNARRRRDEVVREPRRATFAEVEMIAAPTTSRSNISVRLSNTLVIEIGPGFDAAHLRRVIEVVRAC